MAANSVGPSDEPMGFNEAYLTRLRGGDQATAKHFQAHFRRMLNLMLLGKFGRERIDELIGKTMLAAVTNIMNGEPREPERLVGYVRGVCANLMRREIKRLPREPVSDIDLDRLSDGQKSAEQLLLTKERNARVREVLDELSKKDREVLADLFYHELDREEVCRKHGISGSQLRMTVFHARRRFQKKWIGGPQV